MYGIYILFLFFPFFFFVSFRELLLLFFFFLYIYTVSVECHVGIYRYVGWIAESGNCSRLEDHQDH